jgi:hypothetical protein
MITLPWHRRRTRFTPPDTPRDERLIAVGSLSGLPPAEIAGYVLIAISEAGMMSMSGDQCCHGRMLLLSSAVRETAGEVVAEGHGAHS